MRSERARDQAPQVVRFVAVGAAAAGVHYVVALAAYTFFGRSPGVANLIGFAAAFPVSYAGHRWWTFDSTREPHSVALPRFLVVALTAFAANQFLLLLAVRWLPLPFWFLLAVVLLVVAIATYVSSRHWVFRGQGRPRRRTT